MNAVLTEPVFVGQPYGEWSGLEWIFRSCVFPDLGSLLCVFAKASKRTVRFVVSLVYFSALSGRFLPPKLRGGHRSPVTSGFTFFHIGLFNCFLICSCQWCGGPRAVKVIIVTRFPFLQVGHLRYNKGTVSASSGLPRSSWSSGIIVLL